MSNEIVNYDAAWAAMAEKWSSNEQLQGGTFLSTRGGILKFGNEELPGNQAAVIILDSVRENTYYAERFSEDNPQAPICYAYGDGPDADETMAPHTSMQTDLSYFKPQSDTCKSCKWNEWGSADQGRGKACQNRRRLALVPAGYYEPKRGSRDMELHIFTDPKHFQTCEIAFVKLPVMSVKLWAAYVNHISASVHRPPMAVITRLSLEPDPKSQYRCYFEMLEQLPNELASIIMGRAEEAKKSIMAGYRPPQEDAPRGGSLRGVRVSGRR